MSAAATFAAWLEVCAATHKGPRASNAFCIEGATYYLDPHPRLQANGAITGHVYKHVRHHGMRDLGQFKLAPDGTVIKIPAELAPLLPGAIAAAHSKEDDVEGVSQ